jgi:4-amino-4-deoxy-L-arabinose transferase-like glycosyltransferase
VRLAILAAIALLLVQGFLIGHVELSFDEAYYALWARWPQLGYLDHPPLVAWMIYASTALLGGSEFAVRALFWLQGAAIIAMIAWLGWRLFDERTAAMAALLWMAAPLVAGAPLATPDTPLVVFWTLALVGLVEAHRGRQAAWGLVGAALGAAALAKMTAGFLALGIAVAVAVTPPLRRQASGPWPWMAAILALAVASPFLIWNVEHGFATFLKQGARITPGAFAPRYVLEFCGSHLALFNPLTAALALGPRASRALWRPARPLSQARASPDEPTRLLLAAIAPALAYFVLHSLHDRVQANWPAPLFPALIVLAARAIVQAPRHRMAYAAIALGLAATGAAYLHLATAWPTFGPSDPFARIGGWRELSARTFSVAHAQGAGYLLAHGYAATSLLTYYGPPSSEVVEAEEPERWTFRPPVATDGVGLALGPAAFEEELARRYAHVEVIETVRRRVGESELESYTLFRVEAPRAGR